MQLGVPYWQKDWHRPVGDEFANQIPGEAAKEMQRGRYCFRSETSAGLPLEWSREH